MAFTAEAYDPVASADWLICVACGTQFPTTDRAALTTCYICDDPRQYIPASGQAFTTMTALQSSHRNEFTPYEKDPRLTFIASTPKIAIGQRAILVQTPGGNVLWDCITLLDDDTIEKIKGMGGLKAIVISHPHFYSTHVQWARAFGCPVYLATEDLRWTTMKSSHQIPITGTEQRIGDTGATAIKLGGHFPGSMVLLFDGRLLVADTLMTTPAAVGKTDVDATGTKRDHPGRYNSFSFLWSIPNMVPLGPDVLVRMWAVLKACEFRATHGLMMGMDVEDEGVKGRVLESMQNQTKFMGHEGHSIMKETL